MASYIFLILSHLRIAFSTQTVDLSLEWPKSNIKVCGGVRSFVNGEYTIVLAGVCMGVGHYRFERTFS